MSTRTSRFPDAHLVIEIDDRAWHSGDQAALDKRRDRLVKLAGFDTVRVTDDDLRHRFAETLDQVIRIYRDASSRRRDPHL
jgi:very-short-patch-repair endonuclease